VEIDSAALVSRWLLHSLRSSSMEVLLLANFVASQVNNFSDLSWQQEALRLWSFDGAVFYPDELASVQQSDDLESHRRLLQESWGAPSASLNQGEAKTEKTLLNLEDEEEVENDDSSQSMSLSMSLDSIGEVEEVVIKYPRPRTPQVCSVYSDEEERESNDSLEFRWDWEDEAHSS
jgi:hypothetical protein